MASLNRTDGDDVLRGTNLDDHITGRTATTGSRVSAVTTC